MGGNNIAPDRSRDIFHFISVTGNCAPAARGAFQNLNTLSACRYFTAATGVAFALAPFCTAQR